METLRIGYTITHSGLYAAVEQQQGAAALEALKAREKKYTDFSIEISASEISGKSEKQIKYAADLRCKEIDKRIQAFGKKVESLSVNGQNMDLFNPNCPVCAQMDKMLANAGVGSMAEMLYKIISDEAKTLLSMSNAEEIINYCNNIGIAQEMIQRRKK